MRSKAQAALALVSDDPAKNEGAAKSLITKAQAALEVVLDNVSAETAHRERRHELLGELPPRGTSSYVSLEKLLIRCFGLFVVRENH